MWTAGFRLKEWEGPNGRTGGRQPSGTTSGHEREERAAMQTVEGFTCGANMMSRDIPTDRANALS